MFIRSIYQIPLGAAGLNRHGSLLTIVLQKDIGIFLEQNDIPVMDCQALSSVMIPGQHGWEMLKQRVYFITPRRCARGMGQYSTEM